MKSTIKLNHELTQFHPKDRILCVLKVVPRKAVRSVFDILSDAIFEEEFLFPKGPWLVLPLHRALWFNKKKRKKKARRVSLLCPTGFPSFVSTKVKLRYLGPLERLTPLHWTRISTGVAQADLVLETVQVWCLVTDFRVTLHRVRAEFLLACPSSAWGVCSSVNSQTSYSSPHLTEKKAKLCHVAS